MAVGKAIFNQTNGLKGIVVSSGCGVLNTEQLAVIQKIAERNAGLVKMTTRQTVVLLVEEDEVENLEELRAEIEEVGLRLGVFGDAVRNVKGCAAPLCTHTIQDALGVSEKIEEEYYGKKVPRDLKISVCGCPRSCTEVRCADIGLMGMPNGFELYWGGKGAGKSPVHGELIKKNIREEDIVPLVGKIIEVYRKYGKKRERLNRVLNRVGADKFKEEVLVDFEFATDDDSNDFLEFLEAEEE